MNGVEWAEDISYFDEGFTKSYNQEKDEGYFLEVDSYYLEYLHKTQNDLPFLPERTKIEKLVANLHDIIEYVIYIRNLKQALNHGLVLKKVHKVIEFDPRAWLKQYIDRLKQYIGMNTDLRKAAKTILKMTFSN